MKKLEKFESSKLNSALLYNIHGGEEFEPGEGGGGTGATWSVCHIDGVVDDDGGTGATWSVCHIDGVVDGDPSGGGGNPRLL